MAKVIKLIDYEIEFKKPYDLYSVYNDWVADHEFMKANPYERATYELMEEIRDRYILVFKQIKGGNYSLADFEKKAAEILGVAI